MGGLTKAVAGALAVASLLLSGAATAQAAGALAVGSCGAYGYSIDYAQADAARSGALGQCSGKDCKVVSAMKRSCAALAIDGRNACGALGYATAPRLGQAQNMALRFCYKYGGKDCVIRAWACDAKG